MKMNKILTFSIFSLLLVILFTIATGVVRANGAPVGGGDPNIFGTLVPIQNQDVVCENEKLEISLGLHKATVKVTYDLLNTGKEQTIKYGFPIIENGIAIMSPAKIDLRTTASILAAYHYKITENGKTISFTPADANFDDWGYIADHNYPPFGQMKMKLLVSEIAFKSTEKKAITITYEQGYSFTDGKTTKDPYPSFAPRTCNYLLETGRYWKNGIIVHVEIIINGSDVPDGIPIQIEPAGYSTADISKTGGKRIFTRCYDDFSPTKEQNITIRLNMGEWFIAKIKEYEQQDAKKNILNIKSVMKDISATSVLEPSGGYTYVPENAVDGNYFGTVWATKEFDDGGINESITVRFKKTQKIRKVGIIPGVFLTKELYWANNRIKDFLVQYLEYNWKNEPKVIKYDSYEREYYAYLGANKQEILPPFDNQYGCISWGTDPFVFVSQLFPFSQAVHCDGIRIVIRAIAKGKVYNDTCIGEIVMVASDSDIESWGKKLVYGE